MEKQFFITGDHPLLSNHRVYGQRLLSGLAYIDFIYQFFREHGFLYTQLELRKLQIYTPLRVSDSDGVLLTIRCIEREAGAWRVRVDGRKRGKGGGPAGDPTTYVTAEMHHCQPISFDARIDIDSVRRRCNTQTSLDDVYLQLSARELIHSGLMKASGMIYGHGAEQVIQVSLPAGVPAYADEFMFHPTLVDGGAVGAFASLPALSEAEERLFLPLVYDSFRASECFSETCFVRVTSDSVNRNNEVVSMDLTFFNPAGVKIAELNRFAVKLVRDASFIDPHRQPKATTAETNNQKRVSAGRNFPASDRAEQSVREAIASVLGGAAEDIDPTMGFYDMGLDSSGLLHVVSALEEKLSTQLSPTLLFEYTNVTELSEHLLEACVDRFELPAVTAKSRATESALVGGKEPSPKASQDMTDIAIIGMSGRYPGAQSLREFWSNLKAGKHAVSTVPDTRWDWQLLDGLRSVSGKRMSRWGGFIDDVDCFDAPFFKISPGEADSMDPQERLFLEVSWEALEDAGYTPENVVAADAPNQRKAVGVFVGVMHKDYSFIAAEANNQGYPLPMSLSLAPIANRVSYFCDFHGPSMAIDTVCSASLTALHLALDSLRKGESEVALAGGVNLSLHPNKYLSYGLEDMHASEGACRSFGEGGDGYVSAEGVGAVLLKPLHRAKADGDHIYAVIKGSAVNHAGKANGMHVPSPVAQAEVVAQCLEQSGIDPRTIGYVEAHGTGTALGDPIEIQGLIKAFGRYTADKQFCAIGSVKSNIGHAESAAGIGGLSKTVLQLYHQTLVPSLHANPVNAHIDLENSPFYIPRETRSWEQPSLSDGGRERRRPRRAGLSAFGATGSNAHVIVEEYLAEPEADRQQTQFGEPVMIVLSARNPDRLRAYAERLLAYLESELGYQAQDERQTLTNLAYTLQVGRRALAERCGFLAESLQSLKNTLRALLKKPDTLPHVCRGRVKPSQALPSPSDRAVTDSVAQWIHACQYSNVLDAWVKGTPVDWRMVWGSVKPQRVSLPTYPFAKERYWIKGRFRDLGAPEPEKQANWERPQDTAQLTDVAVTQSKPAVSLPFEIRQPDSDVSVLNGREKVELFLQQIIAEQLNTNIYQVEMDERFFDLGLSSAGVVGLINALATSVKINLSPALLFEYATIAALSDYLAVHHADKCEQIKLGERNLTLKAVRTPAVSSPQASVRSQASQKPQGHLLSEGQKSLWALQKRFANMNAYNVPLCFRVRHLNVQLFYKACRFLIRQHPILSAVVEASDGTLRYFMQPERELVVQHMDLRGYLPEQVHAVLSETVKQPFNLEQGPLLRTCLFSVSDDETVVLINVHHIVFDGHSMLLLMDTLFNAYQSLSEGREPEVIPLSVTYDDYVREQIDMLTGSEGEARLSYWNIQLAEPLPVLNLPASASRSAQPNPFVGASYTCALSHELSEKIKRFSDTYRIYASTVLLGLFNVLLSRYSGQEDLIVGMPVNERKQGRFQDVIGLLINMIPVRTQLKTYEPFVTFLKTLQATMIDGMVHQYPFPALIQALAVGDPAQTTPVFQTAFMYQDFLKDTARWRDHSQWIDEIRQEGEYELVLEVVEEKERLILHWKYQSERYEASMIQHMADHYVHLAEAAMADPQLSLGEYSLLSKAEEQKLLRDWNDTAKEYPSKKTLDELFEAQVTQSPTATALVHGNRSLTYAQLSRRVSEVSAHLQAQTTHSGRRVAICVGRSTEMVAGLLGILRAGMTYIPLDPAFPEARLTHILQDSQADIILTEIALKPKVSRLLTAVHGENARSKARVILLDEPWPEQRQPAQNPFEKSSDRALAYIMYTSGSTGRPKGVMIPHQALTNFLLSVANAPGMTRDDKLLAVTTYSFDIAGLELFLPLIVGGQCHIADTGTVQHAEKLKHLIQRTRPTIMQATPSTWNMLFHAGWRNEEKVRILCGGEVMPASLRQRFHDTDSDAWNLFGPTETTIWSTIKHLKMGEPASIGKPIANTQVYVLDKHNRLSPSGVPGELCIAGDGLAAGYLNQPALTAERFVENPFTPGTKLYRTGDLARWMPNGELEYLGRMDFQVKLNGFRIELDEIENHLSNHPAIRESVVILQERGEVKRLIAYYIPARKNRLTELRPDLKAFLKDRLPDYMIPAFFVPLDEMPMTLNGKVDRGALMKRDVLLHNDVEAKRSRSDLEQALLEVWRSVLGIEGIQVTDAFIELGGNSVSATILADRIAARFQVPFTVTDLFKYPTIEKSSQYLHAHMANNGSEQEKEQDLVAPSLACDRQGSRGEHPEYYQNSLAIVGISCRFPGAQDHRQFWKNLVQGKESVTFLGKEEVTAPALAENILNHPAYIPLSLNLEGKDDFDADFFNISRGNAALMDPQFRQLLLHSWNAFEDAGYRPGDISRTGVFMSASNSSYQSLSRKGLQHAPVMENAEDYVSWILAQGGSIPTMISYQLGLKGPSVFVHTNCSSSLTGLYFAYQALRAGDVDCALVGAATLFSAFQAGYVHQPGLNFSSDGHCRTFDAKADGMIAGEGVGVIMVKRAADAIRDGDNIYCLLRGININNDGDEKAGFYAPSVSGQASVIQHVLERTQVDPESIRYVEAHGTGTALGDPIEVAALKEAFERYTDKRQFCGIGSVKPNIGHLDTVAGLAGCVKLALSLHHRKFPAQINYSRPNPEIDFDHSPFYVQEQESTWDEGEFPGRAALSSFGIGGSNAHAILEEYRNKTKPSSEYPAPNQTIIPLSAKNKDRLRVYAETLLTFLEDASHELPALANLAYTLQIGRKSMESRVAFVVSSVEGLIDCLSRFVREDQNNDGIFQGDAGQKDALHALIEKDEDAGELIKRWLQKGKLNQLANIWTKGVRVEWRLLYEGSYPRRISLPTYPFEHQRYQLEPDVSEIGNPAIENALHPLIHRNVSDFHSQQFTSVFHGSEFFLADHVLRGRRVLPGVAYLEMTLFAAETSCKQKITSLNDIVWMQPIIVDEQGCQVSVRLFPESEHTRYEVFSEGSKTSAPVVHSQGFLKSEQARELAHRERTIDIQAIMTACDSSISRKQFYAHLDSLGARYGDSFKVIETICKSGNQVLAKLRLPEHRFPDADAFYLHPSIMDAAFQITDSLILQPGETGGYLPFFVKRIDVYRKAPVSGYVHVRFSGGEKPKGSVVKYDIDVVNETGEICVSVREFCARKLVNDEFIVVRETGQKQQDMLYLTTTWMEQEIGPGNERKLDAPERSSETQVVILAGVEQGVINANDISPRCEVLYFPQVVHSDDQTSSVAGHSILENFQFCFDLIQRKLANIPGEKFDLVVLAPGNVEHYFYAILNGLFITAQQESRKFRGKLVSVENMEGQGPDAIVKLVKREAEDDFTHIHVHYTVDLQRRVKRLVEIHPAANDPAGCIKQDGVYWITGGLGKLGMIFAKDLLRRKRVKIILTGRSPISQAQQRALDELCRDGSLVTYWQADISSLDAVRQLFDRIKQQYGAVTGILHCAGVLRDALIVNKTADDIRQVLAPKVGGVLALDRVTQDEPLDFMALFSSVSGVFGNIGQADYAAANTFLDAFSHYRNTLRQQGKRQGRTVVIDWPLWTEGGMQTDEEHQEAIWHSKGVTPLQTDSGIRAFYEALNAEQSQVIVMEGDKERMKSSYLKGEAELALHAQIPEGRQRRVSEPLNPQDLLRVVRKQLKSVAAEQVRMQPAEIDENKPFGAYGFDSISFTTFSNRLNAAYALKAGSADAISPTLFFEYTTINSLAAYLLEEYPSLIRGYAKKAESINREKVITPADHDAAAASEHTGASGALPAQSLEAYRNRFSHEGKHTATKASSTEEIAIIGMSGKFPMAEDLDAFWRNLTGSRDCITEVPEERWDWKGIYGDPATQKNKTDRKWGGFITGSGDFDPLFFGISPKDAEVMDPCHRLLMTHVWTAIEDAGYSSASISGSKTSVFVGIGNSGYADLLDSAGAEISGQTVIGTVPSMAPGRISHLLNLHGPSEPVDTACSSSLVAIHRGVSSIKSGEADMAIVGGVQGMFSPQVHISFSKAGMLAKDGRCKTFSSQADGYVRGEGIGILVLKRLSLAEADKDHIYGVIKATAENHGGRGNSLTSPNPKAQKELLVAALTQADIDARTIGYMEAHGTGTALGDPIEVKSMQEAFKELHAYAGTSNGDVARCGIGSVKSNIGHLELAAGVASVIKVLLQMKHKTLVPTLHCVEVNPHINLHNSPFYIVRENRKWERFTDAGGVEVPLRAGVSSFGFGGVNAHVVLEEYVPQEHAAAIAKTSDTEPPVMIVLSAKYPDRLKAYAEKLLHFITQSLGESGVTHSDLIELAWTLQVGRDQMKHRLGFVAHSLSDMTNKLRILLSDWENAKEIHWGCAGSGTSPKPVDGASDGLWRVLGRSYEAADCEAILARWVNGQDVEWKRLYGDCPPKKVSAPTYPFAKERYWVRSDAFRLPLSKSFGPLDQSASSGADKARRLRSEFEVLLDRMDFRLLKKSQSS